MLTKNLSHLMSTCDIGCCIHEFQPMRCTVTGEHTVKHGSDEFQLEILINPRQETLRDALRLLLLPPTKHKHLIFAGR